MALLKLKTVFYMFSSVLYKHSCYCAWSASVFDILTCTDYRNMKILNVAFWKVCCDENFDFDTY